MSVYKPKGPDGRPRTPYWHFEFEIGGRRFRRSTGCTSKEQARLVEKRARQAARAALETAETRDPLSIDAAFVRFWTEKGQHDSDSDTTFERMEKLQDGLGAVLLELKRPASLDQVDEDVVARYMTRRRADFVRVRRRAAAGEGLTAARLRPVSPATVNRDVQLLRRIMRRAVKVWKHRLVLPDWGALLYEEPDERAVDMTAEFERRLFDEIREDYRDAVEFLILSGLRCGNGVPLDPLAVDFEQDVIAIRMKSRKPGGRLHVLPLTRRMKILVANNIGRHPRAVFTYQARSTRQGRVRGRRYPITYSSLYSEFKRAVAALGQPDLRPHDLRHVAGTRMNRAAGLRATQRQLGHTRATTSQRYATFDVADLRASMEAVHSPAELPTQSPEADTPAPGNPMPQKGKSA